MGLYTVDLKGQEESIEFGHISGKHNELENYLDFLETRLKLENLRPRTVRNYMKWYKHYINYCKGQRIYELSELNANTIYDWLSIMELQTQQKI
ncbi:hypothetical protein [Alkalibacterium sp. 20]|uniref:hypothetical protein n=1 Tax=Alkalibacterium sp. 20 TaxID=1798803 RepID=UPI0008FFE447|nr:hypothetical protein [Alkalibacterium sp. 20]OJF92172.1 hypothetical protein AX762_02930 [Alkalibacterium sp. 20]